MSTARVLSVLLLTGIVCGAQVLEGTITNSVSGVPIPNATVTLAGEKTVYKGTSNVTGAYRIQGLPAGDYWTSVHADGFVTQQRITSIRSSTTTFDVELVPGASVSGKVLDTDGNPVPGAEVSLLPGNFPIGETHLSGPDGAFHFESTEGIFYLSARPPQSLKAPPPEAGQLRGWVRTYYPNLTERSLAARLTGLAGSDSAGRNIRLQIASLHRVSGSVRNRRGDPSAEQP